MNRLSEFADTVLREILTAGASADFYVQGGLVLVALLLARLSASLIVSRVRVFHDAPGSGSVFGLGEGLHRLRSLVFPVMAVLLLGLATPLAMAVIDAGWLVRAAQAIALIVLVAGLAGRFIQSITIASLFRWVGIPLALLYMVGWLGAAIGYLDSLSLDVGNIRVSAYAVLRTVIFGTLLFWLGRISNTAGQRVIRGQSRLDLGTREVVAKIFEIGIYVLVLLLLMQVVGLDLTALAVFGGALGVGLGFGLQQIASNFISGIIILMDRSIAIGDFIELEDGRSGTLREMTMRSATLETYDGKDIMVPNERFITTAFVNWTHFNKKQRYALRFQVAYKTDLNLLFRMVRDTVASHPKVLSGDDLPLAERPDAEIESFGDSGINILVEFWMDGVDDGENRVGADLHLMIWNTLRANDIEIPFPQRDVNIRHGNFPAAKEP